MTDPASKASRLLACIKKDIYSRDKTIILPLYKTLVWPLLEYAIYFWCPVLRKDVLDLDRVQRRTTKLIRGLEDLRYEDRLQLLNLFSLEKRCLRGDMTAIYKYLNCNSSIGRNQFSLRSLKKTHSHSMKGFNIKLQEGFCTDRVRLWNSLPQLVTSAESVVENVKKILRWAS